MVVALTLPLRRLNDRGPADDVNSIVAKLAEVSAQLGMRPLTVRERQGGGPGSKRQFMADLAAIRHSLDEAAARVAVPGTGFPDPARSGLTDYAYVNGLVVTLNRVIVALPSTGTFDLNVFDTSVFV